MDVLEIGARDEADARRDAVIRRGRRIRAKVLPLEFLADPAERVRSHGAVVQAGVAVAAEQVMSGIDILHSGAMKLRDEAQPDRQLMRPVVIFHLRFHSCNSHRPVSYVLVCMRNEKITIFIYSENFLRRKK